MKSASLRLNTVIILLLLLLSGSIVAAMYGNGTISFADIAAVLTGKCENQTLKIIVMELRLPRLIAALLCGGALGIAGAILQSVLHNPMAAPDLLGISAGGGCAGLAVMLWFPALLPLRGAAVFAGALAVTLMIFAAGRNYRFSPLRLILAGVALSALFGTVSTAMLIMESERYGAVFNFLLGGFSGISIYELKIFTPGLLLAIILPMLMRKKLDILALGDECAATLGISVSRTRIAALSLAALGSASAAGCAGLLSFAGLIAPHTVRLLGKSGSNRFVLPASGIAGAFLVTLSDCLGQFLAPEAAELPAGIFLSGFGALFFILLLTTRHKEEM